MRDPVYDGEVPLESEQDWEEMLDFGHVHRPVQVRFGPLRTDRSWECEVCEEPMYEVVG